MHAIFRWFSHHFQASIYHHWVNGRWVICWHHRQALYIALCTILINTFLYNWRSYIFCKAIRDYVSFEQIPVAARSKTWVCSSPLARIAVLNPAGTWTSISFECSFFCQRALRRVDHSSTGVLRVLCVWVCLGASHRRARPARAVEHGKKGLFCTRVWTNFVYRRYWQSNTAPSYVYLSLIPQNFYQLFSKFFNH